MPIWYLSHAQGPGVCHFDIGNPVAYSAKHSERLSHRPQQQLLQCSARLLSEITSHVNIAEPAGTTVQHTLVERVKIPINISLGILQITEPYFQIRRCKMPIVIGCLFLFLSSFLNLQIPMVFWHHYLQH